MITTLNAKNLSLQEVHQLLGIEERLDNITFDLLLNLEPLTEFERQEMFQIRKDFREYLRLGKVSEGQVKLLVLAPLLRLAGFYKQPIQLNLEQDIAEISIEDEDTRITGRLDILAVRRSKEPPFLWIVVIESKNSGIDALEGLPQLLTYAHHSLENQKTVWGLTTNGVSYRFVYLQSGNPSTYHILPEVNLVDLDRALQLLQILKSLPHT
jgi:hypothetical protein